MRCMATLPCAGWGYCAVALALGITQHDAVTAQSGPNITHPTNHMTPYDPAPLFILSPSHLLPSPTLCQPYAAPLVLRIPQRCMHRRGSRKRRSAVLFRTFWVAK
ncbi:hypothetical protein L202_04482 [Cryptococcus amylolentus CBS 6039]|uniref:Secreted protein n=1 Tax=Cryptococcus amylolentus CBS 6039 TaxID=1295533 RepID=A0A1E3HRH6_9TREE|nr:hypothetical protein L202_04482 [Cryptococcus amylolentus CBS 6039]ODN78968.1 hypothetical protein L202_04482 [Cryptococcus amylolentus CBS 6039]